jgi:hypothetical protein
MKYSIICLVFAGLMTAGCTTSYTCGQFPSSGCQPVSNVYEKTNEGFHDYRKTLFDRKNTDRSGRGEDEILIKVAQAHRTLDFASPGDPVMTKPVTLRVLFNAWVDKDKDLNAGGFYYVKLRDAEWVLNK